jgi:alanine-alpha-ketoisovalerate/valine-pyruvate aminotransferase
VTNLYLARVIEQIKQINEDVIIEVVDDVITVTNGTEDIYSYLLLLFGKVIVK